MSELDLSQMTASQAERHIGHLLRQALAETAIGLFVLELGDGSLRMLDAVALLEHIETEVLAKALTDAGLGEDDVVDILVAVEGEDE